MGMVVYLLLSRDEIKMLYTLCMDMRMKMNFFFGDEYGMMKLVSAPPRCHPIYQTYINKNTTYTYTKYT